MSCQERSGFLFSHDCDQPGVFTCDQCRKMVCALHQRFDNGRSVCVSCFGALPVAPVAAAATAAPVAAAAATAGAGQIPVEGSGFESSRNDDPFFYAETHRHSGWTDTDRAVFRSHTPTAIPSDAGFDSDVDAS